jgi:cysteinyl-tRNA synthetase
MSTRYLGNYFDIHTGGVDNIFPHHENEIAQSVCSSGKPFVHFWLHSEHLIVEGKKMSKSLGNYYTLRDILDKGYSPLAIRYLLLATHYRQQLNFTFDGLEAARNGLERYHDFVANLDDVQGTNGNGKAEAYIDRAAEGFEAALDDDLNISPALAVVFDFIRDINRLKQEGNLSKAEAVMVKEQMLRFDSVLGFLKREEAGLDSEIEELIEKRNEARRDKDFAESDRIRDQLLERGIVLEDTPSGTKWKRKL